MVKVAIGYHIQTGPWGGGNAFARSLRDHILSIGGSVVHTLDDKNIDIILLTDPRGFSPQVSFHAGSIIRHVLFKNPNALVVHRINECDERKGTKNMNRLLRAANYAADHTVFIGSWLKKLSVWRAGSPNSTILNGADNRIFNRSKYMPWNGEEKLRLVTHHWGGNSLKGSDVYRTLDTMMGSSRWEKRVSFTFIGNLPEDLRLLNTRVLPPMNAHQLAEEISKHHVYLTGSQNEPAGMHHIEGALCGLPLIFRRSGALPEYCEGFGLPFHKLKEFESSLERMLVEYQFFKNKMVAYPHTAEKMCTAYVDLFDRLLSDRRQIVSNRRLFSEPWSLLRNQFPH